MTITGDAAVTTFEAAWNQWHGERESYYGDPLGWVSITGLYWLTDEFESAYVGALNVQRVDALIYAVVMESRGIYMSSDLPTAKVYGEGLLVFNDRIGQLLKEWRRPARLEELSKTIAILIVEQHVRMALQVSQYCYVMDRGQIALQGPSAKVHEDPELIRLLSP